jgi:beta-carotene 15,15'-dioxygenase
MRTPHVPSSAQRFVFPVGALLAILLLALTPELLPAKAQLVGLGIVVVVFGLPHGALDPWVAEKIGICGSPGQKILFNVAYLGIAAAVVLLWLWAPTLSLSIFLAISVWHFSGDWEGFLSRPWRLCAGLLLLLMPIGFHTETVAVLFSYLSGESGIHLARTLSLPGWFLTGAMVTLIGLTLWQRHWFVALELSLLLALAYLTPPLIYFALYFCLLHSPRHLLGLFEKASYRERPRLIRMIFIYTTATLFLAALLWWFWSTLPQETLIVRLVFIGLAALTVPHMILIAATHFHQRAQRNQS